MYERVRISLVGLARRVARRVGITIARTACTVHVCLRLATVFWLVAAPPLPLTTVLVDEKVLVLVPAGPTAAMPPSIAIAIPVTLPLALLVLLEILEGS